MRPSSRTLAGAWLILRCLGSGCCAGAPCLPPSVPLVWPPPVPSAGAASSPSRCRLMPATSSSFCCFSGAMPDAVLAVSPPWVVVLSRTSPDELIRITAGKDGPARPPRGNFMIPSQSQKPALRGAPNAVKVFSPAGSSAAPGVSRAVSVDQEGASSTPHALQLSEPRFRVQSIVPIKRQGIA